MTMRVAPDGTAYDLTGPEGAPAVVLIHGLGLSRDSTWGPIVPLLAQPFRVLSYDLPGHGASAVPREAVSLSFLGAHVISLMDTVGIDTAALVGFSLGGMINRRCAIDHPDRVRALAILNSPHDRGEEQQRIVEARARATADGGPAAGIDVTLARWFTEAFRRDHPNRVSRVREVVLANDPENYAAHRQVLAEGVTELIAPEPPIDLPILVMTCEHDSGSTPAMSRAIAAKSTNAEIVIVPGLQHLGLVEQPGLFSEPLLEFLERTLLTKKRETR